MGLAGFNRMRRQQAELLKAKVIEEEKEVIEEKELLKMTNKELCSILDNMNISYSVKDTKKELVIKILS